ncbi:MAG: Fe-S protein assembly chaperone HscA [Candidatus Lambdaproteobacteria bacterium]|nr:Fe-S protein assembly chaperone HscA [Candidatus Lambdaproteobacteria bacterium]
MESKDLIIGIDLGTTNSLAAAVLDQGPVALRVDGKSPIIPSVLSRQEGHWAVGQEARELRTIAPERTVFSVKRLMGRDHGELAAELPRLPYAVQPAQRGLVKVHIGEEAFTPQELSAEILSAVKRNAEEALGRPVARAVITVPAYFDDAQRQATRDAGRIAGLEVVRIINEPTAAAIAYGLDEGQRGTVAVYDLGGGTFDVSVLQLSEKVFKVLATGGDTHLGGDDFDALLAAEMMRRVQQRQPGLSLAGPLASQLFRKTAELVKIDLSRALETEYRLDLPALGLACQERFTRVEFEALIAPLVDTTIGTCRATLAKAGKRPDEIADVVLVGGSSRIPLVRARVRELFGRAPNIAIDPDEVVAIGAGIQGHLLAGGRRDYVLLDVIPLSLGIETLGGTFSKLITANTTIPAEATEVFTTYVDDQTGVELNIYQGEREFVKDCRNLGRFRLRGIPPMPAGLPKVHVTFLVDTNGILTVSAREERSGQAAAIDVIPSHGLTAGEIERIMDESVAHAQEDMTRRQLVEFRNMAEAVFRGIDKVWDQAREMLGEAELAAIRAQMDTVRRQAVLDEPLALKREMDRLGELTRPLADAIMSKAALQELRRFFRDHGGVEMV